MIELDSKSLQDLVSRLKQPMKDVPLKKISEAEFDICQPKYDGWWSALVIQSGKANYVTAGAEIRHTVTKFPEEFECILVGEWMYGTNWSQNHNPGRFMAHDVYSYGKMKYDVSEKPYALRFQTVKDICSRLEHAIDIRQVETLPINLREIAWETYVERDGFEGLVFKSAMHTYGMSFARSKRTFTMDYVVMQVVEGGGRLQGKMGALVGGLYKKDIHGEWQLCSVLSVGGGYTDAVRDMIWADRKNVIGRVMEVKGWDLFPSGALRHPNFLRFRQDKPMCECKMPE